MQVAEMLTSTNKYSPFYSNRCKVYVLKFGDLAIAHAEVVALTGTVASHPRALVHCW